MTNEQRALQWACVSAGLSHGETRQLLTEHAQQGCIDCVLALEWTKSLSALLDTVAAEAAEREREACAEVAAGATGSYRCPSSARFHAKAIARAIRARGGKP